MAKATIAQNDAVTTQQISSSKADQKIRALETDIVVLTQAQADRDRLETELKRVREQKEELETQLSQAMTSHENNSLELKKTAKSFREIDVELQEAKERADRLAKEKEQVLNLHSLEVTNLKQALEDVKKQRDIQLVG